MREYAERMKWQLARWMQGRAGIDELSNMLVVIGIVCSVLFMFTDLILFSLLATVCLALALFRCLSKNIARRTRERDTYRRLIAKPRRWVSLVRKNWTDRKTKRYFICSGCGSTLSVPLGKGKIKVTCPKCHAQAIRKS